jgi:hypothetical protein
MNSESSDFALLLVTSLEFQDRPMVPLMFASSFCCLIKFALVSLMLLAHFCCVTEYEPS